MIITKEYYSSPTGTLFHQSDAKVRYMEGPVGGGKSTTCIMDLLRMAMDQQPDAQNIRRTRWIIIRATNPQLRTTTIKTFQMWIPTEVAPVIYTAPINARMRQPLGDGTILDCEFIFLALDEAADVAKLTSLEATGAYINESREIEHTHFETLQGRINRYPETIKDDDGVTLFGPTHPSIIMDSNPPKTGHWTYRLFHIGENPKGFELFMQPPAVTWDEATSTWGINPDAENLNHLADNYYETQLHGASDEYIRVMLAGEPGMSVAGKVVYPTYVERKHVAPQIINPTRGMPVIIGFDFGLNPAAIILQLSYKGLRVLDELPASDESLEDFISEYLRPLIIKRYGGYPLIGVGDPAGRGRSGIDKRTPFDVLNANGLKAHPAITNNPITRKETVEWFLRRDEGLVISPHCTFTREAFSGGYIYKEQRNNTGRYSERPDKNEYSHIMDALQYAALYAKFGYGTGKKTTSEPAKPYKYA